MVSRSQLLQLFFFFFSLTAIPTNGLMVGPSSSLTGVQENRPITREKAVSACTRPHASSRALGTTRPAMMPSLTSARSLKVKLRKAVDKRQTFYIHYKCLSGFSLQKSLQRRRLRATGSVCQAGGRTDVTAISHITEKWVSRGQRRDTSAKR